MNRYLRILKLIRAGKSVPKEDLKYFIGYTHTADPSKLATDKDFKDMKPEEIQSAIDEANQTLLTNPEYKDQTVQLAKEAEKGRISDTVKTGLNTLLAGTDIANSLNQIHKSNQALNTPLPSKPAIPTRDPYLQQALTQAQRGTFDQSKVLAPAQLQVLDQYFNDINNAKIASTGQAGQFGALAQEAANRRNRAGLQLGSMAAQVRQGEENRLDNLIGQRMNETQNMFENQASLYPSDLNQYNQKMQMAAQLGSVGRENLRNSLANFGENIPDMVANLATKKKYNDIYNQMSSYGDENAQTAVDAEKSLNDRFKSKPVAAEFYNHAYTTPRI